MWNFSPLDPARFRAPARKVTRVFLHCTDSDATSPDYVGPALAATINRWHSDPPPQGNGWAGIGYHFVVDKSGQVITGRPLEMTPAAQLGPDGLGNVGSIAISTHGSKIFTKEGLLATRELVRAIDAAYAAIGEPVTVWGHTELDPRPCPVYAWRELMGLSMSRRFGSAPFVEPAEVAAMGGSWPKLQIQDASPAPIGARVLFEGCHGDDVRHLQERLMAIGFDTKGADEWFGPNTYAAVVAWQKAKSIAPANGIVPIGTII